jgi:hypothetical protein
MFSRRSLIGLAVTNAFYGMFIRSDERARSFSKWSDFWHWAFLRSPSSQNPSPIIAIAAFDDRGSGPDGGFWFLGLRNMTEEKSKERYIRNLKEFRMQIARAYMDDRTDEQALAVLKETRFVSVTVCYRDPLRPTDILFLLPRDIWALARDVFHL